MNKSKTKERGAYRDKLNSVSKEGYFEKIKKAINGIDPYELSAREWLSDP